MSKSISDIHREFQELTQAACVGAVLYIDCGVTLAHSQLFGIASLWFREAGKIGVIAWMLSIARDKIAEHLEQ